ncbi:MAG: leucyl-tRNA synthetase, leucyl-tRNA synthetase [Microgenomates group bacterium GW2011_GWC1_44_37]|nr:MAG: leucyl-tRNA synthetase, leucyl-tRNA synthetase [Microgenomates group bacterium GW2011_GWC1_44_37]
MIIWVLGLVIQSDDKIGRMDLSNFPDENSKRFVAVLNKKMEIGKLMNALGHTTAGLSREIESLEEMCFINYEDKDGGVHPSQSHYPFIVLSADNSNQIRKVRNEAIARKIPFMDFTSTMSIGTSQEQVDTTASTLESELDYWGICKEIEKRWADKYEEFDGYKGVDFENDREKFYMLTEFPYPSGSGLHVGHAFAMTAADVYARFQRMQGKNVMFPMGWDAFGLPTENYAIKSGRKPQEITKEVTDTFRVQMKKLGFSFDWDREVNTTLPEYYKWTQWIFTKLYEKGLAEKKEMPINWCPKDKIGLANEEVIDGKCERCGTETEKRTISQWVVKISDYADRLINGLYDTEFIEKVKAAQINWIGKKEGINIEFEIENSVHKIQCFTKFPETIFGVTWIAIAPEHPMVTEIVSHGHSATVSQEVSKYLDETKKKSEFERTSGISEKTGVFSGVYAINPVNGKRVPVWIGDYVVANFGTGAVMGVAAHDKRDYMFAEKYGLDIVQVEVPAEDPAYLIDSYEKVIEDGLMVNSGKFNGMRAREEAFAAVSDWMVENGWATKKTEYQPIRESRLWPILKNGWRRLVQNVAKRQREKQTQCPTGPEVIGTF